MSIDKKKLLSVAIPTIFVALLRFGGGVLLALFDMGWRCGPRYTMDKILIVLLMVSAVRFARMLDAVDTKVPPCSTAQQHILTLLTIFISLFIFSIPFFYLATCNMFCLTEEVVVQDGQTMVREYKINGGAVSYCYAPVNALVHGADLHYDWW